MRAAVALCIAVAGCATFKAERARRVLPTHLTSDQLERCAGAPAKRETLSDGSAVWDYTATSDKPLISLSAMAGVGLPLGAVGGCHALFWVKGGRVEGLEYTGNTPGLTGALAACAPTIEGCMHMLSTLP